MTAYCKDCLVRDACKPGTPCRRMGDLFQLNQNRAQRARGTTTIMANNSKTNATPADVAAKAAEEKLVVPSQNEGEKTKGDVVVEETIEVTAESPELTVIDGGKKTLKDRLKSLTEKVEANKKPVIALGIAVAAATVAFAKVAAKRSLEKELVEAENEGPSETEQYDELKNTAVASDETTA